MSRPGTVLMMACWVVAVAPTVEATCPDLGVDVNVDGVVNVLDVQCTLVGRLWLMLDGLGAQDEPFPTCMRAGWGVADVDCTGSLDIVDVMLVIKATLGGAWPATWDGDGDGCVDQCAPSCCTPHGGTGCAREACAACVCAHDPVCCSVAWDVLCARDHTRRCREECLCMPVGSNSCCAEHAGVACESEECLIPVGKKDSVCNNQLWDMPCVHLASTLDVASCGCDSPKGGCCEPHYAPGCAKDACQACVCASNDHCCSFMWDESCANAAREGCTSECGCTPLPKGDCCSAHAGTGCDAAGCEACVCATDPLCCSAGWDGICAGARAASCQDECGCMEIAGPDGCSSFHDTPGCNEPTCSECVCAQDPWCCRRRWDRSCVARAVGPCAASCAQ